MAQPTAHGYVRRAEVSLRIQGAQRTAECDYSKLLGIKHSGDGISISVSNPQKPTVLFYGHAIDDWVTNHLTLALALFNGDVEAAIAQITAQINELHPEDFVGD